MSLVFQETNENARIRPDGKVTLFRTGIAGSARCVAEDHQALLVCSGDRAAHIRVRDMKETRLVPKAGTITGFTFLPDGSSFVVTNGYRLVRIGPDGKLKSTTPVY